MRLPSLILAAILCASPRCAARMSIAAEADPSVVGDVSGTHRTVWENLHGTGRRIDPLLDRRWTEGLYRDIHATGARMDDRKGSGMRHILELPFLPSLVYEDQAAAVGLGGERRGWGVFFGDVDANGTADLYLNQHEAAPAFFDNVSGIFVEQGIGFSGDEDFLEADQHTAAFIDVDADGCVDLTQIVGSARGSTPGKNWLLEFGCGFVAEDSSGSSGMIDEFGRGRAPIWFDYDVDGIVDLLLLNARSGGNPSRIFRGVGNGQLEEVLDGAGLPMAAHLVDGAAHDLDFDFDPDLVLVGAELMIFENNGDGTFTDVTAASGVQVTNVGSPVLADVNNDLITDLVWVGAGSENDIWGHPAPEELKFRFNLSGSSLEGLRFTAESESVWIAPVLQYDYRPLNVHFGAASTNFYLPVAFDATDPVLIGEPDLMGTKEGMFIWRDEVTEDWNVRVSGTSVTDAVYDVCRGWFVFDEPVTVLEAIDLDVNQGEPFPSFCFQGNGDLTFDDVSVESGFRSNSVRSRDVAAGDVDNDGDLDLFVVNGDIVVNVRDDLYLNDGDGIFSLASQQVGIVESPRGSGAAAAFSDVDGDGDLEILVDNGYENRPFVGPLQLWNPLGGTGHWFAVELVQGVGDATPLGSRVGLLSGGRWQTRYYDGGQGNRSQEDHILHFGLGRSAVVDSLVVIWPDGQVGAFGPLIGDQRFHIPSDW